MPSSGCPGNERKCSRCNTQSCRKFRSKNIFQGISEETFSSEICETIHNLAYWVKDDTHKCSKLPESKVGFPSWSLVCKDATHAITNCQEMIRKAHDSKFWTSAAQWVTQSTNIGKFYEVKILSFTFLTVYRRVCRNL